MTDVANDVVVIKVVSIPGFGSLSSTPYLFAFRRAEFEADLRILLQAAADDDDLLCERARDIDLDVWRPG